MIKNILISAALMAATVFGAAAQEKIYLVKGDRVVGKYNIEDVDYATFQLPEGVIDTPVWVNINSKSKNSVSYTVNTLDPETSYVHGAISHHTLDYYALTQLGDFFDALNDEDKTALIKAILPYLDVFVGQGKASMTLTDFMDVSPFHLNLMPGTKQYIVAWPIDSDEKLDGDEYAFEEVTTDAPGQSSALFNVEFKRQNEQGLAFNFSYNDQIIGIRVAYGVKSAMDQAIEAYGIDAVFGMFAGLFEPSDLSGFNPAAPEIENATWPVSVTGEYLMLARAYDANGDVVEARVVATGTSKESEGPAIKIYSKENTTSGATVNFEITPSNVEEAYVRLMDMNDYDDRINMGYEPHELAMGGDATDITSDINTTGEYTFRATNLEPAWYTILIYAKNAEGRTTQRLDFYTDPEAEWGEYNPVHAPRRAAFNPTLKK